MSLSNLCFISSRKAFSSGGVPDSGVSPGIKLIWPTIIYGMNNIFQGIAFITDPRNMFLTDNAGWSRCQTASATSAGSPIIHYVSLTESYYKSVTYHTISYWIINWLTNWNNKSL